MAKLTDVQRLEQGMAELLSEYGVNRAGIDAAIDLATEYAETEYLRGWNDCEIFNHIPTD